MTSTNKKWMDECIAGVMIRGKNVEEADAIAMCKRQLISKDGNRTRANIGVINELLEKFSEARRK